MNLIIDRSLPLLCQIRKNTVGNLVLCSTVLPYTPYWILSTDYVNTALVYSCTDVLRLFHVDFAWILGRTRTLPDSTIEKAKDIFAGNNIDVSRMIPSRQEGCDKTLWASEVQHKMVLLLTEGRGWFIVTWNIYDKYFMVILTRRLDSTQLPSCV